MLNDIERLLLQRQKEREERASERYDSMFHPHRVEVNPHDIIQPIVKKLIGMNEKIFCAEESKEAIENLREEYKQCVKLIYFEGKTYSQAAKILNIPIGTVKTRVRASILIITTK